jgi:hypothetical protein
VRWAGWLSCELFAAVEATHTTAVARLRRLVANLHRGGHVGTVADTLLLGQVSLQVLQLFTVSINPLSPHVLIYHNTSWCPQLREISLTNIEKKNKNNEQQPIPPLLDSSISTTHRVYSGNA